MSWNGLTYGPIVVDRTDYRSVRFGSTVVDMGKSDFTILVRLIACQGGRVSRAMLLRGLSSNSVVGPAIYRLRKILKKFFGGRVAIIAHWHGYRISLMDC